jgi:hypothetical protein
MPALLPLPGLERFRRIWLVDFEFSRAVGNWPLPVCCCALELRTGRLIRQWLWGTRPADPFELDTDALYVSYFLPAELSCHLALGWPLPVHALDLAVEYRRQRNGHPPGMGRSLVAALLTHGIDGASFADKQEMQMLAARGGPFTDRQQVELLDYNERDVHALEQLLPAMLPRLDVLRALFRGKYMVAVSRMEFNGIPVDTGTIRRLAGSWERLKDLMIAEVNNTFGVWEGRTFKQARWERWVRARRLPWPSLPSGRLRLDGETFDRMADLCPDVGPVRSLLRLLDQLRDFVLPVGSDGRHRYQSWAFGTITGRHTPKAKECLLLWPKWCRGLVQAPSEGALVVLDYAQQEYLISGILSGDRRMIEDYRAGDVYVSLAKSLGLIPPDGSKATYPRERSLCKTIVLAVTYGMGPVSLARKIRQPVTVANELLRRHRQRYARFWEWSNATVSYGRAYRWLRTRYGWTVYLPRGTKDSTIRNWRVQATGGEVLRAAVCTLDAAGIQLDATLHDSVLVECDAADMHTVKEVALSRMAETAGAVLGEPLRVDAVKLRPGDRWLEEGKPQDIWEQILGLLERVEEADRQLSVPLAPLAPALGEALAPALGDP